MKIHVFIFLSLFFVFRLDLETKKLAHLMAYSG